MIIHRGSFELPSRVEGHIHKNGSMQYLNLCTFSKSLPTRSLFLCYNFTLLFILEENRFILMTEDYHYYSAVNREYLLKN